MMHDLVLKAQGLTAVKPNTFALLPPRQVDIANFMQGRGRVGTGEISKHLGIPPGQTSVFMNVMCGNKVVNKIPKIRAGKKIYLYNLMVANFELKSSGKGIKRDS